MAAPQSECITISVTDADHGTRIDRVLRDALEIGRQDAWDLLTRGAVTHRRGDQTLPKPRKSALVFREDQLLVQLGALARAEPDPSVALPIIFESELVVVCEKPAGLPSGALRSHPRGNVASGLLARYPEMADIGHNRMEPGLIHRLDTWTSGLIVAAKSQLGWSALKETLEAGSLIKEYLAVVALSSPNARVEPGHELSIVSDLGPDPTNPRRVQIESGGRFRTDAEVMKIHGARALLLVRVARAYRHQVRVHLAELGFPLVGDATYGSTDLTGAPRHALHAHYVASSEAPVFSARSPLPPDLGALLGESISPSDSPD